MSDEVKVLIGKPGELTFTCSRCFTRCNAAIVIDATTYLCRACSLLSTPELFGTTKPTNPKDAVGVRKVPFSTISAPVLAEVGLAMLEGARKYGRHNFRVAGVRGSVYYDAVMRHLTDWWEGTDIDKESGIHHVSKAIAGLTVLRDSMIQQNWTDDRPPKSPADWQERLNGAASGIINKYPDAKPAHTALSVWDDAVRKAATDAVAEQAAAAQAKPTLPPWPAPRPGCSKQPHCALVRGHFGQCIEEAKPIPPPPPIPGPTAILECPTVWCVYVKGHGGECGQGLAGYKSDPRTGVEKVTFPAKEKGAAEAAPFAYDDDELTGGF